MNRRALVLSCVLAVVPQIVTGANTVKVKCPCGKTMEVPEEDVLWVSVADGKMAMSRKQALIEVRHLDEFIRKQQNTLQTMRGDVDKYLDRLKDVIREAYGVDTHIDLTIYWAETHSTGLKLAIAAAAGAAKEGPKGALEEALKTGFLEQSGKSYVKAPLSAHDRKAVLSVYSLSSAAKDIVSGDMVDRLKALASIGVDALELALCGKDAKKIKQAMAEAREEAEWMSEKRIKGYANERAIEQCLLAVARQLREKAQRYVDHLEHECKKHAKEPKEDVGTQTGVGDGDTVVQDKEADEKEAPASEERYGPFHGTWVAEGGTAHSVTVIDGKVSEHRIDTPGGKAFEIIHTADGHVEIKLPPGSMGPVNVEITNLTLTGNVLHLQFVSHHKGQKATSDAHLSIDPEARDLLHVTTKVYAENDVCKVTTTGKEKYRRSGRCESAAWSGEAEVRAAARPPQPERQKETVTLQPDPPASSGKPAKKKKKGWWKKLW